MEGGRVSWSEMNEMTEVTIYSVASEHTEKGLKSYT